MTCAPAYNIEVAWNMATPCICGRLFENPVEWTEHRFEKVDDRQYSDLGSFDDLFLFDDDYDMAYYYDDFDGYFEDEDEENPLMINPRNESEPILTAWNIIALTEHERGKMYRSRQRKDTLGKYRGDDNAKAQRPCYRKYRHEDIGKPRRHLGKYERRVENRKERRAIRRHLR